MSSLDSFDGSVEKQQAWFAESQAHRISVVSVVSRLDDCDCFQPECSCVVDRQLPVAAFDPAGVVDKIELAWAASAVLGRRAATNGRVQAEYVSTSSECAAALGRLVARRTGSGATSSAFPLGSTFGPAMEQSRQNLRRDAILRHAASAAKMRRGACTATVKPASTLAPTLQASASDPFRCLSFLGTATSPTPTSIPSRGPADAHPTTVSEMKCVAGGCAPHGCSHLAGAKLLDLDVTEVPKRFFGRWGVRYEPLRD